MDNRGPGGHCYSDACVFSLSEFYSRGGHHYRNSSIRLYICDAGYKKSRNLKADQGEKSQTAEVFDSLDSTANKSEQWIIKNQTKIFSAIALIAISVLSFLGYQRFISEPKEIEAISELNQAQYFFEQALVSSESDSL